jgi:hypothetical protein
MKRALTAGVLAALLVPASASAHPGVYTLTAKLRPANGCTPPDDSCLTDQTQYAVANDGWTLAFTEDNGLTSGGGLINYKVMPSSWRNGGDHPLTPEGKRTYGPAQTNLQAHATCSGTALDNGANILAWQGADPFFNYVPFQATSAGLGDDPSKWIAVVKQATGVDLATVTDAPAACASIGGTYHKADTSSAIATELVRAATDPLQSQLATLRTGMTTLQAAKAAADAAAAAAQAALVNRPLALTLSAKRFNPAVAMITGLPGTAVTLKMKAGKTTLATRHVTLNAQGAALTTLKKAVKKARKVTISATGAGRTVSATGTLTK